MQSSIEHKVGQTAMIGFCNTSASCLVSSPDRECSACFRFDHFAKTPPLCALIVEGVRFNQGSGCGCHAPRWAVWKQSLELRRTTMFV